jgi:phosphoserine phosphatase
MNLVIQGPGFKARDAEELAKLTGAHAIEPISATACRLRGARRQDGFAGWCEAHALDCAWVPEGRRFDALRLLAMDMDSTLVTVECIDEIGALYGLKEKISAITAAAMRGEIDFTRSLKQRVALLAGLEASALERVYRERLQLSPGAEALIERCKAARVKLLLVSGGFTFFTERLKARLGLDFAQANTLEVEGGRLTGSLAGEIVDPAAKARILRETVAQLGATREQVAAIGDGANDLPMIAEAGVSIAYRAKPIVRENATYALDFSGLDGVLNLFE